MRKVNFRSREKVCRTFAAEREEGYALNFFGRSPFERIHVLPKGTAFPHIGQQSRARLHHANRIDLEADVAQVGFFER